MCLDVDAHVSESSHISAFTSLEVVWLHLTALLKNRTCF